MDDDQMLRNTVMETLGVQVEETSADRVVMRMPITDAARQPFGLLHGGVSVVLAESCASIGTWMNIDQETQAAVVFDLWQRVQRRLGEGDRDVHRGA